MDGAAPLVLVLFRLSHLVRRVRATRERSNMFARAPTRSPTTLRTRARATANNGASSSPSSSRLSAFAPPRAPRARSPAATAGGASNNNSTTTSSSSSSNAGARERGLAATLRTQRRREVSLASADGGARSPMARRASVARRARRRAALRARGSSANDEEEEDAFGAFGAYDDDVDDDEYEDDDGSVGFGGGRIGASAGREGSLSARAPSGFDDDTFLGVDMDEDLTASGASSSSSSGRRGRDFGTAPSSSSMHPPEDIITEQEWLDGGDSWYDPVYKEVDAPRGSVLEKVQRMHLNEPGDFTFKDGEYFDLMGYVKAKTDNEFCLVLEVAERARERKIERLESYNSGSSSTLPPIQQVRVFSHLLLSLPFLNFLAACFLLAMTKTALWNTESQIVRTNMRHPFP